MSAIFENHASSLEEFAWAVSSEEGQCGLAFAIGGRVLGLEIFDHAETTRRSFKISAKLCLGHAGSRPDSAQPALNAARNLL